MKRILSIIALFSLTGLCAQPLTTSFGREQPRGSVIAYPTSEEAATAGEGRSKYLQPLDTWTQEGNTFSTEFTVPFAWVNRQIIYHLASATADYEVRVNGKRVGYNANANIPMDFNLSKSAKEGKNRLEIIVSTPSKFSALESFKGVEQPALGNSYVMSQPTLFIRDIFTKTWRVDDQTMAEIGIVLKCNSLNPKTARIHYTLLTPSGARVTSGLPDLTLDMRREDTVRFLVSIPHDSLWSVARTKPYTLMVKNQQEGRFTEFLTFQLRFRTVEVDSQGQLSINGTPETLYVAETTADITADKIVALKNEGYNTLKFTAGIVPDKMYELCDTIGMYVIAQAPIDTRRSGESIRRGGNPSNDTAWQASYLERTTDSYHTTKRHPSVIAFSMAEKSANGINLYESYLNMKTLDEVRPIIYRDARGEWNSDKLKMQFAPRRNN
ncbi:MAG: glycoside hydrolase family 2 TIM barrel-domain containing protein [Alistipes sp.]